MDYRLEMWMRENLPKKDTLSRDAVEILMKLLWEEARKSKEIDMTRRPDYDE